MLLLPDSRVLVADCNNGLIRMLSADLQQVSMVAGDGRQGFFGSSTRLHRADRLARRLDTYDI